MRICLDECTIVMMQKVTHEHFDVGPMLCMPIELKQNLEIDADELHKASEKTLGEMHLENNDDEADKDLSEFE